jgi:iron complex transport system substrate-binding protein
MKNLFSMLLVACIAIFVSSGCGSENSSASEKKTTTESGTVPADPGVHTVMDHGGNTVEVPNTVIRVVIDQIPILSTYMSYFGGEAPYIVGFCGSFKTTISETVLKNIAPELMKSADTVYAQSDLNIEEIIKLKPDVILYNAQNAGHAEILKASGIPSVGFSTVGAKTAADPLERYEQWLNLLEDVFGEEGKMDEFVAAGGAIVADVKARIAEIPEDRRPSALILWKYSNGVAQVSGKGTFGEYWLQHLGVTDVANETGGWAQVSMEQVFGWDPDILFLDGPGLLPVRTREVLENSVEGVDFSAMTAVQNGRVYGTTLGMWNWFTPNPDAPLVLAWLACKTYPDIFADYPLEDTIKKYYKQWYGYDVTGDELAEMLSY